MRIFASVDSGRGRLPTDWKISTLKRVAQLKETQNVAAEAVLLSLRNTGELTPRGEDVQPPSIEYIPRYWLVDEGELVVNPMWLAGGSIGVSRVSGAVSPDYRVYQLSSDLEPRYVHHLLRSAIYIDQYRLLMRAETTFDRRVTKEDFGGLPLFLPPRVAQCHIANFLDTETARIDALIERKQGMIGLFEERRVAMTDAAVFEEPAPARPVAALATYVNGWPFKPDDFTAVGLPVVRIAQLVDPEADTDFFDGELPERVRLCDGDLVFSWSASLQVRIWDRGPAILNQHLFRVLPANGIDKGWLRFALDAATRRFVGLMHGSAMTHITQSMMKQVRVPVPEEARQREIAAALDEGWQVTHRFARTLSTQIALLNEHRQALTTAAVTGQLNVGKAAT